MNVTNEDALIDNILNFIHEKTDEDTNIYVGADSKNTRGYKITQFVVAVVIHYSGSRGAKIFAIPKTTDVMRSVNQRLITEAYYALEVAMKMKDRIGPRNLSVHLDLNVNPKYKSNSVIKQAIGLISGQGLEFKVKPDAIAATSAADYLSNKPGFASSVNQF
jgi:predicted RNase H-related nuclease YkuK (DUF458 family)